MHPFEKASDHGKWMIMFHSGGLPREHFSQICPSREMRPPIFTLQILPQFKRLMMPDSSEFNSGFLNLTQKRVMRWIWHQRSSTSSSKRRSVFMMKSSFLIICKSAQLAIFKCQTMSNVPQRNFDLLCCFAYDACQKISERPISQKRGSAELSHFWPLFWSNVWSIIIQHTALYQLPR